MTRPQYPITTEQVEEVAYRLARGEKLRAITRATGLSAYLLNKIKAKDGFTLLLADAKRNLGGH